MVLHSSTKKDIKGQILICKDCEEKHCIKLSNNNKFLIVDLEYQFRTLLEKEDLVEYFIPQSQEDNELIHSNSEVMRDIHDVYTRKQLKNFLKLLHTLLVQMVLHCFMYPKGVFGLCK